jgi:hypothetical protein
VAADVASKLLSSVSPFGRDYTKVIVKSYNGGQLLDGKPNWVIDFGEDLSESEASMYEAPFEYVRHVVKPEREGRREVRQKTHWWLHARPSPKFRAILRSQSRYIATAVTAKYRVFVWLTPDVLVDHAIVVFAREDDYFFGVLHSLAHECWGLLMGTRLETRPRYTPSSSFETFPFPWPPGKEPSESDDARVKAIGEAARKLVGLRNDWLNPPDITPEDLKNRTLTNLYNKRPEWLVNAHRALDEAVFAAYGWPSNLSKEEILKRLLDLNHQRAGSGGGSPSS